MLSAQIFSKAAFISSSLTERFSSAAIFSTAFWVRKASSASAVFLGGVVSYTNGVKERVLHVPHETLETYSAVSEQTARAMAEGVRRLTGADFGLSVTGVAGPDRDDRGHEVGTVYLALSAGTETQTRQLHLSGSRPAIRDRSADEMFRMLLAYIQIKESDPHGKE